MGDSPCILVVKAGGTFPDMAREMGDFDQWIIRGLGVPASVCRVAEIEKGEVLPEPETFCGAIISGSHAMVTEEAPWSLGLEAWVRTLVEARIPLLGICYGHQILARAMGGEVGYHPLGMELGTVEISCLPDCGTDPLFDCLPAVFKGHVVHSQTVTRLPDNAVLLARNGFEPYHAFRMGTLAWGVQFHPEFNVPAEQGYIRHLADEAREQGQEPETLMAAVEETPHAAALLRRFGKIALSYR